MPAERQWKMDRGSAYTVGATQSYLERESHSSFRGYSAIGAESTPQEEHIRKGSQRVIIDDHRMVQRIPSE
jgi:hypothetical protein